MKFDYPPYPYLSQVLKNCPKAGLTYLEIWKDRDQINKVHVYKKDVPSTYLSSLAKFRHDLLLLVKEALVNIEETPLVIHIELIGYDFDAEGFTLC
jgi:hypothetical protein